MRSRCDGSNDDDCGAAERTGRADVSTAPADLTVRDHSLATLAGSGLPGAPEIINAVGALAEPIVHKLISPEALTELLRIGWPRAVLAEPPSDTTGISLAALGTAWQLFSATQYGIGRYEVSVPVSAPAEQAFVLQFRLAQWRWQLAAVRMPEQIRLLLADEIIKSTKPPPRP